MIQIFKGTIYSFKLLSGEEFIAKVDDVHQSCIDIMSPLSITLTAQGPDTLPGMIAGDMAKPMQLNKSAIAVVAHVEEHIKVSYVQAIDEMQNEKTKQVLTE
jgi:hypothetical protein